MPAEAVVSDDLVLRVGRNRTSLSPSQAFTLAEVLIRNATRAIVLDEVASGDEIRGVLRDADQAPGKDRDAHRSAADLSPQVQ
jgi:hypothetical protein